MSNPESMTRLTIVRPGGLGDSLLLAPALAALRKQRSTEVRLVGYPDRLEPLLKGGLCKEVVHLDAWIEGFQRPSDPTAGFGDRTVSFFAIPSPSDYPETESYPPFPPEGSGVHVAEYIADCLRLHPLTEESSPLRSLPKARDSGASPVVWIHPGAGSKEKRWPIESFFSLAERIESEFGLPVRFLLGEADEDLGPAMARTPWTPVRLPRPLLLAEAWNRGDLFVGNDSGVAHLAGLCGLRTIAIFGPSDPNLWRPWGERVQAVREDSPGVWPSVGRVLEVFNRSIGSGPGGVES